MLETKIKLSRRQLFARKGEAMPTMAVEAGIKPNCTTGPFAGLSSAVNGNDLRSAEKLVQASTLSSLITRRIPRAPVTAPEAFYAKRPIARPVLRPAPVFTKDSAVPERPEAILGPSKAKTLVAERHKRHQFTVRLKTDDFQAMINLVVRSGRTYQDIIESAVRHYLNDVVAESEEATENESAHQEPAMGSPAVSELIGRSWSK